MAPISPLLTNLTTWALTAKDTVVNKKKKPVSSVISTKQTDTTTAPVPKPLDTLVKGATDSMNTVTSNNQQLAKTKLSDLKNTALDTTAQAQERVDGKTNLLNQTVGIANQAKDQTVDKLHLDATQSLADFMATRDVNPNISAEEIQKKFPEFKGKEQALADFVVTIEEKPDLTPEELKVKFPEFYPDYEPEPSLGQKAESYLWGATKSIAGIAPMIAESGLLDKPAETLVNTKMSDIASFISPEVKVLKKSLEKLGIKVPDKTLAQGIQSLLPADAVKDYQKREGGKKLSEVAKGNFSWDVNSKEFKQWQDIADAIQIWVGWATLGTSIAKNAPKILNQGKGVVKSIKNIISKQWEKSQKKSIDKITKRVLQQVQEWNTATEKKIALKDGRLVPRKEPGFFKSGNTSYVQPSKKSEEAARTIAENVVNPSKDNSQLYIQGKDKIAEIANDLSSELKKIPVSKNNPVKDQLTSSFEELSSLTDEFTKSDIKKFDTVLDDIKKRRNLDDASSTRKGRDDMFSDSVKSATDSSAPSTRKANRIWMEGRNALNDYIEEVAKNQWDDMFRSKLKTQSNIYHALGNMVKRAAETKKSIKLDAKFKKALPYVGTAVGTLAANEARKALWINF